MAQTGTSTLLSALICLLCGVPAVAYAQERPARWHLINADEPVVANGVLFFRFDRGEGSQREDLFTPPFEPMVVDASGAPVPGSTEVLSFDLDHPFAVFRPDGAFEADDTITVSYGDGESEAPFMTVAAEPLEPAMFDVTVTLETTLVPTLSRCCDYADDSASCLALRSMPTPTVVVSFDTHGSVARQFLYTAWFVGDSDHQHSLAASEVHDGWSIASTRRQDEYCYRVTSRTHLNEFFTIADACIEDSLGELSAVGVSDEMEVRRALAVSRCEMPPSGLAQAWCEVNRETCAEQPELAACAETFESLCRDYPSTGESLLEIVANVELPPDDAVINAGAGGIGGMAGVSAGMGGVGGAADDAGTDRDGTGTRDPSEAAGDESEGGCSVSVRRDHASALWLGLGVLSVVYLRRRVASVRRERRCSTGKREQQQ